MDIAATRSAARTEPAPAAVARPAAGASFSGILGDLLDPANLIAPTPENVQALSRRAAGLLKEACRANGIAATPPLEIEFDPLGRLRVMGDRADEPRIREMFDRDPELARACRDLNAIASHLQGMRESLAFQEEYRASSNPEAVVAKYRHLFAGDRPAPRETLRWDGDRLGLFFDGKPWNTPVRAA